jgi:NTE family protein
MMHIGVIRYLEEKNITINHITGTSIGSVIGGLYALGQSSDEIAEHFRNLSYTELVDLDFSTGVIKGKKIVKLLDNAFKNERIENLPVRLSIVATNLSEG